MRGKRPQRQVYLDSSAIGHVVGAETRTLWMRAASEEVLRRCREGVYLGFIGSVGLREIGDAPGRIRSQLLRKITWARLRRLRVVPERVQELVAALVGARFVGPAQLRDLEHIAQYCLSSVDVLLSFNLKHIASVGIMNKVKEVTRAHGIRKEIVIRTPAEFLEEERLAGA